MGPQFLNAVAGYRGALFLPQVFADVSIQGWGAT
jgi:hypothetical protein